MSEIKDNILKCLFIYKAFRTSVHHQVKTKLKTKLHPIYRLLVYINYRYCLRFYDIIKLKRILNYTVLKIELL